MSDVNVTISGTSIGLQVGPQSYYLSAYSTQDQTNAGATSVNKMTYNTTDFSNGVSIVSNSRITIANAGVYNIEFSAQLSKGDSGDDTVQIWLCAKAATMPNINTKSHG